MLFDDISPERKKELVEKANTLSARAIIIVLASLLAIFLINNLDLIIEGLSLFK